MTTTGTLLELVDAVADGQQVIVLLESARDHARVRDAVMRSLAKRRVAVRTANAAIVDAVSGGRVSFEFARSSNAMRGLRPNVVFTVGHRVSGPGVGTFWRDALAVASVCALKTPGGRVVELSV